MNSLLLKLLLLPLFSLYLSYFPGMGSALAPSDQGVSCLTYVPSAISPNGDGINDTFQIEQQCQLQNFCLRIYDPSGQLVYQSRDARLGWDGSVAGQPAPEGYYDWVITYQTAPELPAVEEKGELVLVR